MQTFSGLDYVRIDIANKFGGGLDRTTWEERLAWVNSKTITHLINLTDRSKEPMLYIKAIRALEDGLDNIPTGYIMGLDATASGLQIMAAMIGCHKTASLVNLKNTGKREDVYQEGADYMSLHGVRTDRDTIKKPIMTHFYGSRAKPIEIFGKNTKAIEAFYDFLYKGMPGASKVMNMMQAQWQPDALHHSWTMPDGHRVITRVMQAVDKRIEVDEMHNATFTHRAYINNPDPKGLALAAHITHSTDAYILREMSMRAELQGFQMAAIHDEFWAHPNHMNQVRDNYRQILADIADSTLLADILSEIRRYPGKLTKMSDDLSKYIRQSEYALS